MQAGVYGLARSLEKPGLSESRVPESRTFGVWGSVMGEGSQTRHIRMFLQARSLFLLAPSLCVCLLPNTGARGFISLKCWRC